MEKLLLSLHSEEDLKGKESKLHICNFSKVYYLPVQISDELPNVIL